MQTGVGRAAVILVIVAAAVWAGLTWWPSEERRVRTRIDELARIINDRPKDGLALVARAAQLSRFFEDDVVLDPGRGAGQISGRERLVALASRAPNAGGAYRVRFVDVSADVDGDRAAVRMTATLSWTDARGEDNVDAREVDLAMRKSDDWRIARITTIDPLERPQ